MKTIWITWENQIRNLSMSQSLCVPLFVFISKRSRFSRYLSCGFRTFQLILKEKPKVVVCQNPSLMLTCLLLFLRFLFSFKVVIDAHYAGVEASNGNSFLQSVINRCNRLADLVIVTNEAHASYIESLGGNSFICPDPLPELTTYRKFETEIDGKVFFICSFDSDEPYLEVFKAAEILYPKGFKFFVSGRFQKIGIRAEDYPYINFLGFVPEEDFYRHLFSAQIVIDLTNNDNCLVCGAYEAMEAGKPLILSKKIALQNFFNQGTVFTENLSKDIVVAIENAKFDKEKLKKEACIWRENKKKEMKKRLEKLTNCLYCLQYPAK